MRYGMRLTQATAFIGLMAAQPASATLIVDTGPGPGGQANGWCLGGPTNCSSPVVQWLAAEFVLPSAHEVTGVWGWMRARTGAPDVQIAIYADGGDVPAGGAPLFVTPSFVPGATAGWFGVSGLSWTLAAGEWWVAFQSNDPGTLAVMPFPSASRLTNEAFKFAPGPWGPADGLSLGVRIEAEAVPEPATLLLLGGGLVGLASRRRRIG